MKFKQMFCNHNFKFKRNIYGDEIIEYGWKRSIYACTKCNKVKLKESLHD